MTDARCLRVKAKDCLSLADHNGGWEAAALKTLAADCISEAEGLEGEERPKPSPKARRPAKPA